MLDERHDLAAVDSTGLESGHVSRHYLQRVGGREQVNRHYHTVAEVVDVRSHLCLACWTGMGPAPDQPHFLPVMRQARRHHPAIAGVLADAGHDGERYQKYLYERLKILAVVMPRLGTPARNPKTPLTFHRRFLHQHWPTRLYAQRAQAETRMSMSKRLLGSHLTARRHGTRRQQIWLRSITLNLMINADAPRPP